MNQNIEFNSNKRELVAIKCENCNNYDIIPCVLVPELTFVFVCNICKCEFMVTELTTFTKITDERKQEIDEFNILLGEVSGGIKKYLNRVFSRGGKHYERNKKG